MCQYGFGVCTCCFSDIGQNSCCGTRAAKGQTIIMDYLGSPFSDD